MSGGNDKVAGASGAPPAGKRPDPEVQGPGGAPNTPHSGSCNAMALAFDRALAFFCNQPLQIYQMYGQLRRNPSMVQDSIQHYQLHLGQTDPEHLQQFNQYKDDFIRWINETHFEEVAIGGEGACGGGSIGPTRLEDMQGAISVSRQGRAIPMEKLKEVLECPVCLKIPRKGPIYQCEGGHCVCLDCYGKLTKCPICKRPRSGIRSLVFEQCLAMLTHDCKFIEYGCLFEGTIDLLKFHEPDCLYRLVNCCVLECQTKISMVKFTKHLMEEHPITFHEVTLMQCGEPMELPIECQERYWIPDHIELNDNHFFLECWRNNDGLWALWVYMLGSKNDCKEYAYTITVYSDDKEKKGMLVYQNSCVPLDLTKEQIALQGKCLTFTDPAANEFLTKNEIKLKLIIKPVD